MAYLDRSAMDHLGSVLSSEYAPLVATSMPRKLRDWVFQYTLAQAAVEAERRSREARLKLREMIPDSSSWSDEVAA